MRTHLQAILIGALAVFGLTPSVQAQSSPPTPVARPGEIIVQVPGGMSGAAVDQLAGKFACEVIRPIPYSPGFYLFGLKSRDNSAQPAPPSDVLLETIEKLRKEPGTYADPNWIKRLADVQAGKRVTRATGTPFAPSDPLYATSQKWDLDMIRMPEAWNIQSGGRVVIGVVDSGVEMSHPDFRQPDGTSRIIEQSVFVQDNFGATGDPLGHGTHVAGTIAATTNNSVGVASVGGLYRGGVNVQIVSARVFGSSGGSSDAEVYAGFNYVVSRGVRAINLSLGGLGLQASQLELSSIQNALRLGIVVVAAAGNDSLDTSGIIKAFPADIPGVISVSAVGTSRHLTWYSNYGGNVTIAAPGGDLGTVIGGTGTPLDVTSTWPVNGAALGAGQNGYNAIAGTSMASPHVCGVVALLLAAGAPSNQVAQTLRETAQAPPSPDPLGRGVPSHLFGAGIVDAFEATLRWADPDPAISLVGPLDRGVSYFQATPITVSIRGVNKIVTGADPVAPQVRDSDVKVEIQTIGRNPATITLRGGRNGAGDFEIPTLGGGNQKSDAFTVTVPRDTNNPVVLGPNQQYKIVTKIGETITSTQFLTVAQKVVGKGRSMFALPFKASLVPTQTPEISLLGSNVSFSLARYNALRLSSEQDYARFRSNGSVMDPAARFLVPGFNGPLTFDTADPSVSIAPIGLGYWLDLDQEAVIDTTLLPTPGVGENSPISNNAVGIRAFASGGGWNMIGAPFTYPVEWASVTIHSENLNYSLSEAVNAGILSPALVGYGGGDYRYAVAPAGQLEPFQAYWVRVFRDCTIIVPPIPASGASRSRWTPTPGEGWSVRLAASIAGDRDGQNYFGQVRGARGAVDAHDILKPPAGAGHAYVRFDNRTDDGRSRALAFDMRPLGDSLSRQEWVASVSSDRSNADVTLTWEGIRSAPRRGRLTLTDLGTGQVVAMQSRSSYTYRSGEAGTTRQFRIALEPQASAGPLTFANVRIAPVTRGDAGLAIRFSTNQDAEIAGVVQTITGRRVGALIGTTRAAGATETTLRWDGRGADGNPIPAGPYVIEVQARSADGQTARFQRTIQYVR